MVAKSTSSFVRFSTVEIREYPVVIGTNPSTVHGPPVELDWLPQSSKCLDLEQYEADRSPHRRRTEKELIMTVMVRVNRLLDNGVTFRQINSHTKETTSGGNNNKHQTRRQHTKNPLPTRTRKGIWRLSHTFIIKTIRPFSPATRRSSSLH